MGLSFLESCSRSVVIGRVHRNTAVTVFFMATGSIQPTCGEWQISRLIRSEARERAHESQLNCAFIVPE